MVFGFLAILGLGIGGSRSKVWGDHRTLQPCCCNDSFVQPGGAGLAVTIRRGSTHWRFQKLGPLRGIPN